MQGTVTAAMVRAYLTMRHMVHVHGPPNHLSLLLIVALAWMSDVGGGIFEEDIVHLLDCASFTTSQVLDLYFPR